MRLAYLAIVAAGVLSACDGGGGSSTPPAVAPPAPPPPPTGGSVTISGTITYDFVPFNANRIGLNYGAITQRPARGVVVEAADSAGAVVATTETDSAGAYALTLGSGLDLRIQARAQLRRTQLGTWDIAVRDNTAGNAAYLLVGAVANTGGADSSRSLNAPSGWGGAGYTGVRAAAPFAILDSIYDGLIAISGVVPGANFPALQVFWSVNNRAADGSIANGEIGSTSFTRVAGVPTILVLGAENADTDEYDAPVIVHELGHYVEDAFARSDSIGGPHSLADRLDTRVAMSEGWSNAFSSAVRNDPFYRDSSGPQQSQGFAVNLEGNTGANLGHFSERSVQSISFDVFDAAADGADTIAGGFGALYSGLASPAYANNTAPTAIYSYQDSLRALVSGAGLDLLLDAQSIFGRTAVATGETNDGGIATSLPVFRPVVIGAPAIQICSVDDAGTYNKLGNRTLIRLSVPTTQALTFRMTRVSGATGRDPDFIVFQRGVEVAAAETPPAETEVLTQTLAAGDYFIDAYDFFNVNDAGPSGDACYDFSVL
jgi:hypothetical protein